MNEEDRIIPVGIDLETCGPDGFPQSDDRETSLPKIQFDASVRDDIDVMTTEWYKKMLDVMAGIDWRKNNKRWLTDAEEEMNEFIHQKNTVISDETYTEKNLRHMMALWSVSRRFNYTSCFDFNSLYPRVMKPASVQDMIPDGSFTLKASMSEMTALKYHMGCDLSAPIIENIDKMFVLPTTENSYITDKEQEL